jgi:hypothetical protein
MLAHQLLAQRFSKCGPKSKAAANPEPLARQGESARKAFLSKRNPGLSSDYA